MKKIERRLLSYPHPMLERICQPVRLFTPTVHKQLDKMKQIMLAEGGVGLAANQIGIDAQMFVMKTVAGDIREIINPRFESKSAEVGPVYKEGCLSSKNVFEWVDRHKYVAISYEDRDGNTHIFVATAPRDSVCIQHEMDHLHGIFWWDRLGAEARASIEQKYFKGYGNEKK